MCLCELCHTEGARIFSENETYPRALLHWTRAAAQGEFKQALSPRQCEQCVRRSSRVKVHCKFREMRHDV